MVYIEKSQIPKFVNEERTLKAKAYKAFTLRNEYRTLTREYMKDRKRAKYLEQVEKTRLEKVVK